MKKYIIAAVVFAACLALYAAVWPQTETTKETLIRPQASVARTTEPTIEDITPETEITLETEEEKIDIPQLPIEPIHEVIYEPVPVTEKTVETAEVQQTPESEPVHAPEPTPVPAPSQTVTDPQPGDTVYVPGFGWLECQGPGEVIHDESIYENGNRISIMG